MDMNNKEHMKEIENTFEAVRDVSLSNVERETMKKNVRLFMAEHPLKQSRIQRFLSRMRTFRIGLTISPVHIPHVRPAIASLFILIFVGASTSYAAEMALPGDILYPVKTVVNENVVSALAFSEEAKANRSATLALRRLEEAGALVVKGRLTASAREEIESRFEKHVEDFEMRTDLLAQQERKVEVAVDAQSFLEAALKAHASALIEFSVVRPETEHELRSILAAVSDRVNTVESARTASERTIAIKVGEDIRERAAAKRRTVENEIAHSRSSARQTKAPQADTAVMTAVTASQGATTTSPAPDLILEALNAGSAKFEEGRYGEAFTAFQGALRAVQQDKLKHNARERLKLDDISGLPSHAMPQEKANKAQGAPVDMIQEDPGGVE